jgi:hypothetical protein
MEAPIRPIHTDVTTLMKRIPLLSLLTAGLMAVASAPAAAAQAAPPLTATDCGAPALAPALSAFGDARSYFLAPGGDFESTAHGWSLTGGAMPTAGSGPLRTGAAAKSLRLPAGATATSPVFCVDLNYPTFRFFHAQGASGLSVDVIYPALGTTKKPKTTSVTSGSASWTLSKDLNLRPDQATNDAGLRQVQLRFVAATGAKGKGDWLVDDVLIDPRMRG